MNIVLINHTVDIIPLDPLCHMRCHFKNRAFKDSQKAPFNKLNFMSLRISLNLTLQMIQETRNLVAFIYFSGC